MYTSHSPELPFHPSLAGAVSGFTGLTYGSMDEGLVTRLWVCKIAISLNYPPA